jgi:hypothetical protein
MLSEWKVGSQTSDHGGIELNRAAYRRLRGGFCRSVFTSMTFNVEVDVRRY